MLVKILWAIDSSVSTCHHKGQYSGAIVHAIHKYLRKSARLLFKWKPHVKTVWRAKKMAAQLVLTYWNLVEAFWKFLGSVVCMSSHASNWPISTHTCFTLQTSLTSSLITWQQTCTTLNIPSLMLHCDKHVDKVGTYVEKLAVIVCAMTNIVVSYILS